MPAQCCHTVRKCCQIYKTLQTINKLRKIKLLYLLHAKYCTMSKPDAKFDLFAPETILKTDESVNAGVEPNLDAEEERLMSMETLRESPVQWPERFPGIDEFLTMSDTPIHTSNVDYAQQITSEDMATMNKFAQMTPEQLIEKIKSLHDEIYQLGVREAKEMTRGKLLGIFDRVPSKRKL